MFRSSQLSCDLHGLSFNVGECIITQSSILSEIRNLLSYDACSTIIRALINCRLDYCHSNVYTVTKSKTDRLQRLRNQCARILTKSPRREHITPVLNTLAQNSR